MYLPKGNKFRFEEIFPISILTIGTVERMMIDSIHTIWCPHGNMTIKPYI